MPDSVSAVLRSTGEHEANRWRLSLDVEGLPEQRPAIIPLELWRESYNGSEHSDDLAPCLTADTQLDDALVSDLRAAPFVAIHFPVFTDGRGYTLARLLRERYAVTSEIRAVGDVLIDQLFYMRRCGFDAFTLREDQLLEPAIKALNAFSLSYQPGVDICEPLFARRVRERKVSRAAKPAELVG